MEQIRHKKGGGAAPSLGFRKVGGGHAKGQLFALQICHRSPPCGCTPDRCIAASSMLFAFCQAAAALSMLNTDGTG